MKIFSKSIDRYLITNLFLISLMFLPLFNNIIAINYDCLNAIDFSIYQQAIFDISAGESLNPYLTIRGVPIFNDHFDPILLFAVFLTRTFGENSYLLLFIEWLFYLGFIFFIFWSNQFDTKKVLPYLFIGVFTKMILSSLLYPLHPTTWSLLPLTLFTYLLFQKKPLTTISVAFLLCFFKESFAFALLPCAIILLFLKRKEEGLGILLVSTCFVTFELFFKETLIGKTINYGSMVIGPFFQRPFDYSFEILGNLKFKKFFKAFYPFVLPCFFYLKNSKEKSRDLKRLLPIAAVFFPLLFLQVLINKIDFQYGAIFSGILIGPLLALKVFDQLNLKEVSICLLLFLASSLGTYTKMTKLVFLGKSKKCEISKDKKEHASTLNKYVDSITKNSKILASGGVIPQILRPLMKIYHIKGFSKPQDNYDYLILSLKGDPYPATTEELLFLKENCRNMADNIDIDNEYYFAASGNFTTKCSLKAKAKE